MNNYYKMPSVIVNLGIRVDAEGEIVVFGQQPPSMSEYVDCSVSLPISALYSDASNSLFEFWEPSDAIGTIKATHATSRNNSGLIVNLASGLQSVLEGELDASTSIPFKNSKYSSESAYRVFNNFGRLALSSYAHYLFGHVAATAAISNDQDFMDKFLAYDTEAADTYDATSWATSTTSKANLSLRLADAILKKTDEEVLTIVEQVLGQDASRAKDQDNNELSPDVRQALRFEDGDVIYFTVRVQPPTVTVQNNGQQYTPASSLYIDTGISYNLKVTLISPPDISYSGPTTRTFATDVAIDPITPTNVGGTVTSYSIDNTLPSGLTFNTITGVISGTPTVSSAETTYTITASNSTGTSSSTITFSVIAPPNISYSSSITFRIGTSYTITPTNSSGPVSSYSIDNTLPSGLTFNTTTGVISGIPDGSPTPSVPYIITATGPTGATSSKTVNIIIKYRLPVISYSSTTKIFTNGYAIDSMTPTNTGGPVTSYSVSPSLPSGLSIDSTTGVISGTPSVTASQANYVVTATGSGGNGSVTLTLTVVDPPSISYPTPLTRTFTTSYAISSIIPSNSGGDISGYAVSPSLPSGLSIDSTTGVISGTPTATRSATNYVVTATGTGSVTSSATLNFTVVNAPNISFSSTNRTAYVNSAATIIATNSGGAISICSISPSLPSGLTFNTANASIAGTPTVTSSATNYTITVTGTGGAVVTYTITITVLAALPIISYQPGQIAPKIGVAMNPLVPISTGGAVTSYSISPSLPSGLSIDSTTGVISGTPTTVTAYATYTITATGSGPATTTVSIVTDETNRGLAEWITYLDGTGVDSCTSVVLDNSGNIYASGSYISTGPVTLRDVSGNTQKTSSVTLPSTIGISSAAFLAKYNANGQTQWATYVDGSGTAGDIGQCTVVDPSNNIIVVGKYTSTVITTLKDASGNTQKNSTITLPVTFSEAASIIKYNSDGQTQWATLIDGSGNDQSYSVITDASGNIYVSGSYSSGSVLTLRDASGNTQKNSTITLPITSAGAVFLVKYNSSGQVLWATSIDGTATDNGRGVTMDSNGFIYVTGNYNILSGVVTLKDVSGTTQNNSTIKLPATLSSSNAAFVAKYNQNGIAQWATSIDGSGADIGYSIAADLSSNIYISGQYIASSPITLKDVSGTTQSNSAVTLPVTISNAALLVKYNSAGQVQWATNIDGSGSAADSGWYVTTDSKGFVYMVGGYNATTGSSTYLKDVSGNTQKASTIYIPSNGGTFITKYNSNGIAQWANYLSTGATCYSVFADSLGNLFVGGSSAFAQTMRNASGNTQAIATPNITTPSSLSNATFIAKYV